MNVRRLALLSAAILALTSVQQGHAVVSTVVTPDSDNGTSSDASLPDLSGNSAPAQKLRTAPITQPGSLYDTPLNPSQPNQTVTATPSSGSSANVLSVPNGADPGSLPYSPAPPPRPQMPSIHVGTPTFVTGAPGVFRMKLPTSVIQVPQPAVMDGSFTDSKPTKNVDIELAEKNWSDDDIQIVVNHLGLAKDKVASSCYIAGFGTMLTDQQPYSINTGTNAQVNVAYDGTINNMTINVEALCKIDTLPPDLGFIQEMGGRYITSMATVPCAVPSGMQPKKILLSRQGGITGKCIIQ